jgi:hypothetical protein
MGQHYGAVPLAGEHTVSKAIAVGRTDERSKTFLDPFVVQQKDLGCRAETRPGGSTHHWVKRERAKAKPGRLATLATRQVRVAR